MHRHHLGPKQVILRREGEGLDEIICDALSAFLPNKVNGTILVKPNLLKPRDLLCVTSGPVILSVCRALSRLGARVVVGDSPAFGSARRVIAGMGDLHEKLEAMGVEVRDLGRPVNVRLPMGIEVGVSRLALEADLIVNVPRLKAHCQMRITCSVKNLYGTVVGFRKAFYHLLHGGDIERFSNMILEIASLFERVVTILDCITPMHVTGPSGGIPMEMNLIGASDSPVALDTAIYEVVGAKPKDVPLWRAAQERGIEGARSEEIEYPFLRPEEIHEGRAFVMPTQLEPLRFSPIRFIKGRTRSLIRRIVG